MINDYALVNKRELARHLSYFSTERITGSSSRKKGKKSSRSSISRRWRRRRNLSKACPRGGKVFAASRWWTRDRGALQGRRTRGRREGLRQTECRKSHVNSGRRLICKHNARQLYGSTIERPDAESASFSLPLPLHSLVNFYRTPILAPLHASLSLSLSLSLALSIYLNVLTIVFSFFPSFLPFFLLRFSRSADTEIRASPRLADKRAGMDSPRSNRPS